MCHRCPLVAECQPSSSTPSACHHRIPKQHRRSILQEFRRNTNYLLDRCLSYDWTAVKDICLVLIGYFEQKQRHRKVCTAQLQAVDAWGNTPLHAASYFQPPSTVLRLLLEASRLYQVHMTSALNVKKATPLVIACSSGVALPALELLLQTDSSMIFSIDDDHTTPLVALTRRYQMLRRIPKLSKQCVPLEQISKKAWTKEVDLSKRANETKATGLMITENDTFKGALAGDLDSKQTLFCSLWIKMEAIIRAGWSHKSQGLCQRNAPLRDSFHSTLHGAAHLSHLLPPVLTELMIRCHDKLVTQDSNGILPLHLAVTVDSVTNHPTLLKQRAYFIDKLLQAEPQTAKLVVPCTGCLPFMEAIASGLSWHLNRDTESKDALCGRDYFHFMTRNQGPLQRLWNAAPDAITQFDPVTGLRPFMLAASIPLRNDVEHLDTIFSLFRA